MLAAQWPGGAQWQVKAEVGAPVDEAILLLDSTKARTQLGWAMPVSLEESLGLTRDWYVARNSGASTDEMRALSSRQIETFAKAQTNA